MSPVSLAQPGTLVQARGREWVVLPESTDDILYVRPVGGLDEEATAILPVVEPVASAAFGHPRIVDEGDFRSGRLLRDAARLSTRAAAGPFRSFGRIAVEPRPYQLVPLMMALKLDPVRMLIADDVGIGKTVEACVIARELLDRGEIRRLAVLCPPHLAEQWQKELREKFHIEAELVLSSTIQRLERDLLHGVSVFDKHRFTVVSTDYIKAPGRADDFALKCPEFVIVDEAHGCTSGSGVSGGRQRRNQLLRKITEDDSRHVVLVTATPHSGNEEAFRSLMAILNRDFGALAAELDGADREGAQKKLAAHLVQRRRPDIRRYLEEDTAFPERFDKESTYTLSDEYKKLFLDILEFAREYVQEQGQGQRQRRVRYWSALALLRCVSSSPAAAAATLRCRAAVDQVADDEIEEEGQRTILDQDDSDDSPAVDFAPGSDMEDIAESVRRRLLDFARRADKLPVKADHKLQGAAKEISQLVKDGFQPVVFCRFVHTARYVAEHLRAALGSSIRVESVTGDLPPSEREARIAALTSEGDKHVLVATDCLSEGINLQENFAAVFHYDLAWNPTRHEQREGRVDRFGQRKSEVRVLTYYGTNNPIDGVILDVLIRKHKKIKSKLGVTVAVPEGSEAVAEALFEGLLFRTNAASRPLQMNLAFIDEMEHRKKKLHDDWDKARDREKASRSRFAQHAMSPEAVHAELLKVRAAIGAKTDVERFVVETLRLADVPVEARNGELRVSVSAETPRALRQALGHDGAFAGRFELPLEKDQVYLGRTSPVVEGLAGWVLDQSLDEEARDANVVAARCGVTSTRLVSTRTILLVARFRYHLKSGKADGATVLCEEIVPLACTGSPDALNWLDPEQGEALLAATPDRNVPPTGVRQQLEVLLPALAEYQRALVQVARRRAEDQRLAHEKVRENLRVRSRTTIEPVLPVDILGAFVLLPTPATGGA